MVRKDNADSTKSGSDKEEKPKETTSRSQSRKRGSIFGTLLGKKEEHEEKKEVKKEEAKEEEAKPAEPTTETGEAAVATTATGMISLRINRTFSDILLAAPAAVATEEKKPEEVADKKPEEAKAEPTPHKSKRASLFGGLFQKKDVTSPTTEKTKEEVAPAVPAKDESLAVAETAPQIDTAVGSGKPIEPESVTKPIDTPTAPKETTTPQEITSTSPSKGGFKGFLKKAEGMFEVCS